MELLIIIDMSISIPVPVPLSLVSFSDHMFSLKISLSLAVRHCTHPCSSSTYLWEDSTCPCVSVTGGWSESDEELEPEDDEELPELPKHFASPSVSALVVFSSAFALARLFGFGLGVAFTLGTALRLAFMAAALFGLGV